MLAVFPSPAPACEQHLTIVAIGTCEGFPLCPTGSAFTGGSEEQMGFSSTQALIRPLTSSGYGEEFIEHGVYLPLAVSAI